MSNQDALGDRRRHTLTGSVSQIPLAFYFAPRPQVSRGSSVGRSKSCSKDVKFTPRPRTTSNCSSGGTPSSHRMSTERPDAIQSKAMVEVKGHGNNVLKKKRRTSRNPSVQASAIPRAPSFDMVQMLSRPGTSPTTSSWTPKLATDPHPLDAISRSTSSSGGISASTTNISPHHPKQKSLWLNRKASYLPDSKPFPTPPPPPKILMKHSPSSLSLEASLTSSSTATLTTLSPKSKPLSFSSAPPTKTKTKRIRPPNPSRLTSALTTSSSAPSLPRHTNNLHALNVSDHSNSNHRGRTASTATSVSMYSQQSYPHHLQLPETEDDNRLGTKDWFLVEDEDVDSSFGFSFAPEKRSKKLDEECEVGSHVKGKGKINGASESVALGSKSNSRNGRRSRRRARSRSRTRTPSRHPATSSKSISSNSNSNSRCTSPTYPVPGSQSQYLEVPPHSSRCHRHHRKRSTDTAFTTGTFATTSTAATTSTTSGWRRDIAEVKEGMKSFLDMSVSGLESADSGEHNRESQWFELEVPSESESCLTPVSTMTETPLMPLTVKSKKSRSKSNAKPKSSWKAPRTSSPYSHSRSSSASNHQGPAPAHTPFLGNSISDRYSHVLPRSPSPSPAPTLSYVVFEDHNEELKARYPMLSLPSPNTITSSSFCANSNSYLPSPSLPPYSPNEVFSKTRDSSLSNTVSDTQAHLDSLQLDYDYSFAVDVLVHVPESLVDPSFRGNATNSSQKGHARKASVSASIRVNLRPEEIANLTKSGTIRRSNSNKAKAKKGPKLSKTKWSFGNGNKVNAVPVNGAVENISVARSGIGSILKKEKKKSLVLQVTNFFTRV